MPQMNISITTQLASYVKARVKSGRYNNASELVRDALRRLELEDERTLRSANPTVEDVLTDFTAIERERARKRVLDSIAQIERGEYAEYEGRAGLDRLSAEIKAEGRQQLKEAAKR